MTFAFTTDKQRWTAVINKDASASDKFVYSVISTGIYCRSNCPGRRARRANVDFYDTAAEAEARGFRACKRCKPEIGDGVPEETGVRAVKEFISAPLERLDGVRTLQEMAGKAGLSKWYFHRVFVRTVGVTPGEWLKRVRSGTHGRGGEGVVGDAPLAVEASSESTSSSSSSSSVIGMDSPALLLEEDWWNLIDYSAFEEHNNWLS